MRIINDGTGRQLDRNDRVGCGIAGFEDRTHPPLADFFEQQIIADLLGIAAWALVRHGNFGRQDSTAKVANS
jgi:hypothetical protein